jgi:hypothetical protein
LSDVKAPTFLRNSAHRWRRGFSPIRAVRQPLTAQEDSWCSFLLEAESTPEP